MLPKSQVTRNTELARRFSHKLILDPLVKDEDRLTGMHANTQIPKVIGYKRIADLAQDDKDWNHASECIMPPASSGTPW